MKPLALFAALTLIFAGLPAARGQATAKGGDASQELKNLLTAWNQAIINRDPAAIDRILSDDYVLTTPEGRLVSKAQILKAFESPGDPSFVIKDIDLGEVKIRFFGDTAIVSSRFTLKVQAEVGNVETPFRHTDVFVKRKGGWRCESRHATRIRQSYGHEAARDDEPLPGDVRRAVISRPKTRTASEIRRPTH